MTQLLTLNTSHKFPPQVAAISSTETPETISGLAEAFKPPPHNEPIAAAGLGSPAMAPALATNHHGGGLGGGHNTTTAHSIADTQVGVI